MKMIPKTCVRVFVLLLAILVLGCGAKRYAMKDNEEIYGTWVSEKSSPQKLVMMPNGTWEEYLYQADLTPAYKGIYEVTEKWVDAEGNVWYKEFVTSTFGLYKSDKSQELDRIDKSGRIWEFVFTEIGQYDAKNYPKEINPKENNYRIYERATK
jgi:hypothetical protein